MADPLALILLVAAGESADAATRGVAAATREALGADSRVFVRESDGPPDDAEAMSTERADHADAVVELRWEDPRHARASIRMHVSRTGLWTHRRFLFRASDADAERERTLGFAIASILPEVPPAATSTGDPPPTAKGGLPSTVSPPPAVPSGETLPPNTKEPAPGAPSAASASGAASASAARPGLSAATPSVTRPTRIALEVFAVDAEGNTGGAHEVGGAAAVEWFATRNIALRAGAQVRGGEIDAAQADLVKVLGSAGVAFHPWRSSAGHPFGASLRVDYVALYQAVTHYLTSDRNPSERHAVLSGLDMIVDASWLFAANVEGLAGGGFDAFAPTYINVGTADTATLPAFHGIIEAGLRLHF